MVSEDRIDMSLDDIIASNKKSGRGRGRGGRGRGGGRSRGGSTNRNNQNRRDSTGPMRRGRGGARSAPYNRPRNIPDKWEHDMYDGTGKRGASGGAKAGLSTGSHLQISNLDFGVTEADIKELFLEFGKLKKAIINYDSSGRSHGTADVVFERKEDAAKAYSTYNGVPLDGRPMKIEHVTPQITARRETSSRLGNRSFNNNTRGNSGGNRRGQTRGQTRGGKNNTRGNSRGRGRGGNKRGPPPSKEDLDKELDSYIEAAN